MHGQGINSKKPTLLYHIYREIMYIISQIKETEKDRILNLPLNFLLCFTMPATSGKV